jgi:iron complex outermembrane receptor protein
MRQIVCEGSFYKRSLMNGYTLLKTTTKNNYLFLFDYFYLIEMKNLFAFLCLFALTFSAFSQEEKKDSTQVEILDEVLVKSVRVSKDAPVTHSNLSKEELAKRNLGQDIPVLMNYMPNVVTTTDAGAGIGYTGMRVRGTSGSGINVTINGIPYNDTESQGTFWVNLPDFSSSVENLQLQRGVGTSTNGAGAYGASINLLTDGVSENASAEFSNSFGSYGTRKHTAKFATGKLNDHFEFAGRLSKIKSDGYVDRAFSDLSSYFLQASYVTEKTLIKALAFGGKEETYQSWYGLTAEELEDDRRQNPYTYENEVDHYNQDHYQLHWNQKINTDWSTNVGVNYTYGRGYYEQYKEDQAFADYGFSDIVIGGTTITETDLIRRKWLDNDFYVLNASANYNKQKLDITFGSSYSYYQGDHFGEVIWAEYASDSSIRHRYYDNTSYKSDISFFTKADIKLNSKILLYGDLQVRNVAYKANALDVEDSFTFFNPKAGLTFKINNYNSLYTSYARANREPNRTDYENGDPESETLNDFELGWRVNQKNFNINTNLYYMRYENQLVLTGALDLVGSPIRENVGKSYRFGLEIDAKVKVSKMLNVQPNISISANRNKDFHAQWNGELRNFGNTNISFSPNVVAGNAFNFMPTKNLQISLLSKFVGEQYMSNIDSEASKLDSYFTSDVNITYEIKPNKVFKSIVLSGLINNVFNKEYVSNGYYYNYEDNWTDPSAVTTIEGAGYYPQATINFLLGATFKF